MQSTIGVVILFFSVIVLLYNRKTQFSQYLVPKPHRNLLLFDSVTLNGGKSLNNQEPREFVFFCQNVSADTVTIDSMQADCSCSVPFYEKSIPAGEYSVIKLIVAPALNKSIYSTTLRASNTLNTQIEVLTVNVDVVEGNNSLVNPPILFLGNLVLEESFHIERRVRLAIDSNERFSPISVLSPAWLTVNYEQIDKTLLLKFSGVVPPDTRSTRGQFQIKLSPPYIDQTIDFVYSTRNKYEAYPKRLFGSIKNLDSGRSVKLLGVTTEDVLYDVTVNGSGKVKIANGEDPCDFIVTPEFSETSHEVQGAIKWSVKSNSGQLLASVDTAFLFVKLEP
jgi:hypothetical protein